MIDAKARFTIGRFTASATASLGTTPSVDEKHQDDDPKRGFGERDAGQANGGNAFTFALRTPTTTPTRSRSDVIRGRRSADVAAALDPGATSFVVFMIGMRINRFWMPHKWIPVAAAMPPMVRELRSHPELGMLGTHQYIGSTIMLVQYWRSFEHLERFAQGEHHLPAWRNFNKRLADSDAAGFFHETYEVPIDGYEVIYNNLPNYGLAAATTSVEVTARGESARQRIGNNER